MFEMVLNTLLVPSIKFLFNNVPVTKLSFRSWQPNFVIYRSSHQTCFVKKDVLRNFAKFTGKHMCQRLFFNIVAGLRTAALLKRSFWHRCFPLNFAKFPTPPFLQNILGQLLLYLKFSWHFHSRSYWVSNLKFSLHVMFAVKLYLLLFPNQLKLCRVWYKPLDTRRKLNVQQAFRGYSRRLLNACTFNLRPGGSLSAREAVFLNWLPLS